MIKVLIVEDDPVVAEMNKSFLDKVPGFSLYGIVDNCEQALEVLRKQSIDLLLVDIFLPGMNGLEMLAQLRSESHGADVIMLTAARDMESVKKALQLGAVDYLIKPVALDRFSAALNKYAERFKLLIEGDLNQRFLDEHILERNLPNCLPKGLEKQTLKVVENAVGKINSEFTVEQLVEVTGISRVTLRKYLDYLVQKDELRMKQVYGCIGRPVTKYSKP